MNQIKLFWLLPFEVSLTPPSEITEVAITDSSFGAPFLGRRESVADWFSFDSLTKHSMCVTGDQ